MIEQSTNATKPRLWLRLIVVILLLVTITGALAYKKTLQIQEQIAQGSQLPPPISVTVAQAQPDTWNRRIRAVGTLVAFQGVDITTEEPASWNRYTAHAMVTESTDRNGVSLPHDGHGGIAYLDVFGSALFSYDYSGECASPAWVLEGSGTYTAGIISHEVGHNLGFNHDGQEPGDGEYYHGHDNGVISWCPIMGSGSPNVSQ